MSHRNVLPETVLSCTPFFILSDLTCLYFLRYDPALLFSCVPACSVRAQEEGEEENGAAKVEDDIGKSRDGSKTDDEAVQRYDHLHHV